MKSNILNEQATPEAIKQLYEVLMESLVEVEPQIAMSVIFTLASRLSVMLDIPRDDYIKALTGGYDAFTLLATGIEGKPLQ